MWTPISLEWIIVSGQPLFCPVGGSECCRILSDYMKYSFFHGSLWVKMNSETNKMPSIHHQYLYTMVDGAIQLKMLWERVRALFFSGRVTLLQCVVWSMWPCSETPLWLTLSLNQTLTLTRNILRRGEKRGNGWYYDVIISTTLWIMQLESLHEVPLLQKCGHWSCLIAWSGCFCYVQIVSQPSVLLSSPETN